MSNRVKRLFTLCFATHIPHVCSSSFLLSHVGLYFFLSESCLLIELWADKIGFGRRRKGLYLKDGDWWRQVWHVFNIFCFCLWRVLLSSINQLIDLFWIGSDDSGDENLTVRETDLIFNLRNTSDRRIWRGKTMRPRMRRSSALGQNCLILTFLNFKFLKRHLNIF